MKVVCVRYWKPGGMVEISPQNPIPTSEQKATAAHSMFCSRCYQAFRVVTRDPWRGEILEGDRVTDCRREA